MNVTSTTLTGATIGNLIADTWFRAVVSNEGCTNAISSSVKITVTPRTQVDCYTIDLLSVIYSGGNTTFRYKVCSKGCANALSYISFITDPKATIAQLKRL